eukprot:4865792-Pyramimonas_sp.AAC.1
MTLAVASGIRDTYVGRLSAVRDHAKMLHEFAPRGSESAPSGSGSAVAWKQWKQAEGAGRTGSHAEIHHPRPIIEHYHKKSYYNGKDEIRVWTTLLLLTLSTRG